MPYIQWHGIMINGAVRTGACFAQSHDTLDAALFKQGIALVKTKQPRFFYYRKKISRKQQSLFFDHLGTLLNAGIELPDALILAAHNNTIYCQEIAHSIATHIRHGISLMHAFDAYNVIFDNLVRQLLYVGQKAETVAQSCLAAATYLRNQDMFYQELRSALLLPCITFCFVIALTGGIFTVIVPYFATLLTTHQQQLPALSRTILTISLYVRSSFFYYSAGIITLSGFLTYRIAKQKVPLTAIKEYILLRTPYIGTLIRQYLTGHTCAHLALLIDHGISLTSALETLANSTKHIHLQADIIRIQHDISTGISFDAACATSTFFHDTHTQALIRIGQESGTLPRALAQAGAFQLASVSRSLRFLTTIIQPLLLIILGLIIATIIIGLYEPILTLTGSIS